MSDGALFKPEKDFSKEADKVIPEAETLAKKDIQKGIDKIIVLEKQSRQVYKHQHRSAENTRLTLAIVIRPCHNIKSISCHSHNLQRRGRLELAQ